LLKRKISMKVPPYLKKGDTVGIVATARKVSPEEMMPAKKKLEEWGLKVVFGEDIFNAHHQLAGTDGQRLLDIQKMLDEPEVKAVLIARGGYGTVRIIDRIEFLSYAANPKWIAGFSDITVLHSHVQKNFGVQSIHSLMPINFPKDGSDNQATETLRKALFGEEIAYGCDAHPLNRQGAAKGVLTGGNLSILYSLTGTSSQIDTRGKILFLEDLDEYLYHLDRMMMNLKRSGMLSELAGLVVGGMTDMKDNVVPFGKSAQEIILDAVGGYDYPVCFGFPAGHIDDNRALVFGREAELKVDGAGASLFYH
jgi:muramoyltetrapeptide carboxypeptidase